MTHECTEELFLKDVDHHVMSVLRDDGLHRHIRFKRADSGSYWFDLITWPGTLCIDGDCGTYVFRRLEDMFRFFRTDRDWLRDGATLAINPGYWGEKLQAKSMHGGYEEFSADLVRESIKSRFDDWVESEGPDEAVKADLWEAIENDVLYYSDEDPHEFMRAIHGFNHNGFEFTDFWETKTHDYTFHFIWCCYAIAWGVKTYDEAKKDAGAA
jgi:hypothetical protein